MLYVLFGAIAIFYNILKFRRKHLALFHSIINAKEVNHRDMILAYHFYVFVFELFIAFIVSHLLTEKSISLGLIGLVSVYLLLLVFGFFIYQFFVRFLEKKMGLIIYDSFRLYIFKELRLNLSTILLPVLIYSLINWAFLDSIYDDWGAYWFLGLILNIILVSVLTIICSVVVMLKLIPNRDIIESEYFEIISKRLIQAGLKNVRLRWVEANFKNAFVVGLKLGFFSNQTMFVGKNLRSDLNLLEFDAVISHEISHMANGHINKRVLGLLKNFLIIITGLIFIVIFVLSTSYIYLNEEAYLQSSSTAVFISVLSLIWFVFNYSLLFQTFRKHEFEADAFAVMILGVDFKIYRSALEKLLTRQEIPEYFNKRSDLADGAFTRWLKQKFSTHPDLEKRISFLDYKISNGLPFNYFPVENKSPWSFFNKLFKPKMIYSSVAVFLLLIFVGFYRIKTGLDLITFVESSDIQEIMRSTVVRNNINKRPLLTGNTLMFYIVKRKEHELIDFYSKNGAHKGKALIYISQTKDYELFKKYFYQFQSELTQEDFFLVLRKTALINFTEGIRLLVNSDQFESLSIDYKKDVSRALLLHSDRKPASKE